MAIECSVIYMKGSKTRASSPKSIERLGRVEAGEANTYRCNAENIGAVVRAGCNNLDRGGMIYITNEESLANALTEDGNYSSEKLDDQYSAILPAGSSMALPIICEGNVDFIFLFTHLSPN